MDATHADELHKLDALMARARACGVHDLQRLSAAEAQALEPALACAGAVLSPSTGIVDSHGLMTALLGDAENAGALTFFQRGPNKIEILRETGSRELFHKLGGASQFDLEYDR